MDCDPAPAPAAGSWSELEQVDRYYEPMDWASDEKVLLS